MDKAKAAATRALELDPTLAEAHSALAIVQSALEWKWAEAEQSFRRAIELKPSLADTHNWYAGQLVALGRLDEAIEEMRAALEHDPFEPWYSYVLGVFYHFAGDDERAFAQLEETLELYPTLAGAASRTAASNSYQTLGMMHCEHGRFEQGIRMLEKALELSGDAADKLAPLAYGHALAGNTEEARKLFQQIEARAPTEFVSPLSFALVHTVLGEHDEAFEWLERAYEGRWLLLPSAAAAWPPLNPLRTDPRFADLLRRMGLPQAGTLARRSVRLLTGA